MNNSDTPAGAKRKNDLERKAGMKEINVKESDATHDLLQAYFDMTKDEMIDLHVMSYKIPKVATKEFGGDEQENTVGFSEIEVIDAKNVNINRNPQEFRRAWKENKVLRNSEKSEKFEKAVQKIKKMHEDKIRKENEREKAEKEKSKNQKNSLGEGKQTDR